MKAMICERCGGGEFVDRDGYRICQYCNTRYLIKSEDVAQKGSIIALDDDIEILLQKWYLINNPGETYSRRRDLPKIANPGTLCHLC